MINNATTKGAVPRDKPATAFHPDPHLTRMLKREREDKQENEKEGGGGHPGDDFGVVLVAGWPPNLEEIVEPYEMFLDQVKQCFDKQDFEINTDKNNNLTPNVYLYPAQNLHMTIATFRPFTHDDTLGRRKSMITAEQIEEREYMARSYKEIVQAASQREDWPKSTIITNSDGGGGEGQKQQSIVQIRLKIDGAQIGSNAGILLWKEIENNTHDEQSDDDVDVIPTPPGGWIARMRRILREEYDKFREKEQSRNINSCIQKDDVTTAEALLEDNPSIRCLEDTFKMPPIIHSTFLRFGRQPITDGTMIQEKFQSIGLKDILFDEKGIQINSARLVVERNPYMHIPCDENHVLETLHFGKVVKSNK